MAITLRPVFNLNISLEDRDKNVSTMTIYVPSTSLLSVVEEAVTDFIIPAIQGISDATVIGWSLSVNADETGLLAPPLESSDVERKGVFSFRAANNAPYVVSVPSIKNTLVIDETNKILKTDALVLAFTNAMTDPAVLDLVDPTTYLGSDLVQLEKAEKHHRGSRRG
jgi:hypothetical protein